MFKPFFPNSTLLLNAVIIIAFISCREKEVTLPVVSTDYVESLSVTTVKAGANIISDGGSDILDRGFVWNTFTKPSLELNQSYVSEGGGPGYYSTIISGLKLYTDYYIRAYASNKAGISYGNEIIFQVDPSAFKTLAKVTTKNPAEIRSSSALAGGVIVFEGTPYYTSCGVCWSTHSDPTIDDMVSSDSSNLLNFSCKITGLEGNTLYYLRAFATNLAGTTYGNQVTFTTLRKGLPVLTLTNITNVDMTGASCEANVLSDEGEEITVRGICWSTIPDPTTSNDTTMNGSGTGKYNSALTGLAFGTDYYVRAYASNSTGTAYSNVYRFTTIDTGLVIKDIDGNLYNQLTYGDQVWLSSNLKVTKYQDGSQIQDVTSYDNNESYVAAYGRLYGRDAAINTVSVCPVGWHVPTSSEWRKLAYYLVENGYSYDGIIPSPGEINSISLNKNKLAKSLSSDYNWGWSEVSGSPGNSDYPEKRNSTRFNAMPGGCRFTDGTFMYLGSYCLWWNQDLGSIYYPAPGGPVLQYVLTQWTMIYDSPDFYEGGFGKAISIRCIRNSK